VVEPGQCRKSDHSDYEWRCIMVGPGECRRLEHGGAVNQYVTESAI
jgi:hypothetical protein